MTSNKTTIRTTISTLALAAVVAVAALLALTRLGSPPDSASAQATSAPRAGQWTATAPGRIEPRSGEIKLSAQIPGRLVEISVNVNDAVAAGDLLARIDDEDLRSKYSAADTEANVRKRERDQEAAVGRLATDRRQADDAVAAAERALHGARQEFDRVLAAYLRGEKEATTTGVADTRKAVATAKDKLEAERAGLRRAQTAANIPLPTRLESGLANARSEVSQAEAAIERARIRAPSDGVVLQINPRVGELVAASPEQPVLSIGDLSALRVRAELEERDVPKVRLGQAVVVRSDAYAGREFSGRVTRIAKTMAPSRISQRGPRRPNDLDALEIMVELDATDVLLPGMRVDVLFKADAAAEAPAASSVKAETKAPTLKQ